MTARTVSNGNGTSQLPLALAASCARKPRRRVVRPRPVPEWTQHEAARRRTELSSTSQSLGRGVDNARGRGTLRERATPGR